MAGKRSASPEPDPSPSSIKAARLRTNQSAHAAQEESHPSRDPSAPSPQDASAASAPENSGPFWNFAPDLLPGIFEMIHSQFLIHMPSLSGQPQNSNVGASDQQPGPVPTVSTPHADTNRGPSITPWTENAPHSAGVEVPPFTPQAPDSNASTSYEHRGSAPTMPAPPAAPSANTSSATATDQTPHSAGVDTSPSVSQSSQQPPAPPAPVFPSKTAASHSWLDGASYLPSQNLPPHTETHHAPGSSTSTGPRDPAHATSPAQSSDPGQTSSTAGSRPTSGPTHAANEETSAGASSSTIPPHQPAAQPAATTETQAPSTPTQTHFTRASSAGNFPSQSRTPATEKVSKQPTQPSSSSVKDGTHGQSSDPPEEDHEMASPSSDEEEDRSPTPTPTNRQAPPPERDTGARPFTSAQTTSPLPGQPPSDDQGETAGRAGPSASTSKGKERADGERPSMSTSKGKERADGERPSMSTNTPRPGGANPKENAPEDGLPSSNPAPDTGTQSASTPGAGATMDPGLLYSMLNSMPALTNYVAKMNQTLDGMNSRLAEIDTKLAAEASAREAAQPSRPKRAKKPKPHDAPDPYLTHPQRNRLKDAVRKHFLHMLKVPDLNSVASVCPSLQEHEVLLFVSQKKGCIEITANNFRVDLKQSRDTPFNQTAISVFARDMHAKIVNEQWYRIAPGDLTPLDLKLASVDYLGYTLYHHLKHVKEVYQAVIHPDPRKREMDLEGTSRNQRKNTLHKSRLRVLSRNPHLGTAHYALLKSAGTQADSSDESEPDSSGYGPRVYRKISPAWRSRPFSQFLWALDDIAFQQRQPKVGCRRIRGTAPRTRLQSTSQNPRTLAPPGLPRNCYDEEWLKGLWEFELRALNILNKDHDFSISTIRPPPNAGPSMASSSVPPSA